MNILIDMGNALVTEAVQQLLMRNGFDSVMTSDQNVDKFIPDVVLADIGSINPALFTRYPKARVLLMDTGIDEERIVTTLLSYKIHGILSPQTEVQLFKKAMQVVSEGQIWIGNNMIKAFLHNSRPIPRAEKMNGTTGREKEIIGLVCQGCSNKEIALKLCLSEHTIKAHLARIFRKFNATNRSKLMTLAMNAQ